jgi:hypothetical protein
LGQLDEAAHRIHQPHLLDRLAVGVEEARGTDEDDARRSSGKNAGPAT